MSETVTLEIHRDAPPEPKELTTYVLAKRRGYAVGGGYSVQTVVDEWSDFEWWSEMPAPVKPKRFVVETRRSGGFAVNHKDGEGIPTREIAQRIADFCEEVIP